MLIEYKVKFREDGLTLTQRFESDSGTQEPPPFVDSNRLLSTYSASKAHNSAAAIANARKASGNDSGTGPGDKGDSGKGNEDKAHSGHGGDGFGSGAPVTFIGPFFFCCPRPRNPGKEDKNG